MAVTYPAGQARTYTAADVQAPRSGPVLGGGAASVAFVLRDLTDTVLLTVPATAPTGSNDWSATVAFPATPGDYLLSTVVTDAAGPTEVGYETVTLRRVARSTAMTRTRLIQRIAMLLGEDITVTASENSDAGVVIDQGELNIEPGYMESRELFCIGGTLANIGEARRIVSNSRTSRSLTIDPPMPAPIAKGDTFLILNFRGTGFRSANYIQAINNAIIDASRTHLVRVEAELPIVESLDRTATVTIPDEWSHFSGIDVYLGGRGLPGETYRGPTMSESSGPLGTPWKPVRRSATRGDRKGGYWLDGRTLEINGVAYGYATSTGTVKAYGYLMPEPLLSPDDDTTIDPEWLTHQAAQYLLIGGLTRDPTREGLAVAMQRRADSLRAVIRTSLRANTVALQD